MFRTLKLTATLFFMAFCLSEVAIARGYQIKMHRPTEVGERDRASVVVDFVLTTTVKNGSRIVENTKEEFSIEFEAIGETLRIDSKGRTTKAAFTVVKCRKIEHGRAKTLLPKGTEVLASVRSREQKFEVNGKAASGEVTKVLNSVISLSRGGPTDDQVFGTSQLKYVGDRWGINKARAVEGLAVAGLSAYSSDISGFATVERTLRIGQIECLEIGGLMQINPIDMPLPEGFTIDKSSSRLRFGTILPVDTSMGALAGSMALTMSIVSRHSSGMTIEMVSKENKKYEVTYLD